MGIDLTGDSGEELRFSGIGWAFYLNLAQLYGWHPVGTRAPDGALATGWSGQYDSSDGQHVGGEDATALADALARALADPKREETEKVLAVKLSKDLGTTTGRPVSVEPPDDDTLLREFLGFCRKGGFRID